MPEIIARGMIVHTREEMETFLELVKEVHTGKRPFPPQIVEKQKQIADAIRNAELFTAIFSVVDQGMVNDIVTMKLELDALCSGWMIEETPPAMNKTLH